MTTSTSPLSASGRRPARDASWLLRTVLRTDSASTAAFAVLMLAAAALTTTPLGLPRGLAVVSGCGMVCGAAAFWLLARQPVLPRRLVAGAIALNVVCGAAFAVLACTDLVPLTGFGRFFLAAGAVIVAVFAELEYVGLRRIRTATP
ncbi:hypothetical protein [Streptomyces purpurogeneiscleroticus]|uniref:hypothetical protein n=1 Tax=Streptomyces purpurogeneiscleroticus TaxID=68259 RepID=UPI001CBCC0A0|nr:hypothetical protein [Streptomyces purpurogeneiscleroticus]MBZ4019198.1 hypothetical protein [Streptomyces purpurogeneiscleroticus]